MHYTNLQIFAIKRVETGVYTSGLQSCNRINAKTGTQTLYQYLSPLVALPIAVAVAKKLNDDQVIGIIKKEAEEDAITTI